MNGIEVERWDTYEIVLTGSGRYKNPFTEVKLSGEFIHEGSNKSILVDGFYDGDSTWRVRFMPTELGAWRYETKSEDSGLNGQTGTLVCVEPKKPYLHGPLQADGFHFRHADGTHRYLISTRVSCQFAAPSVWDGVIEFCKDHRINRIFFIMGGVYGMIADLYGEGQDFSRYNIEKFRAIDAFIDASRQANILAGPYFYYCNDGVQCKMTLEEDKAYLRYGMARFGAYCNVMPCLSNQLENKYTKGAPEEGKYVPENYEWGNEVGRYLKEKAVFGVPVTVHNPKENHSSTNPSYYTILRDWQFPWADYMLRQMQIGALGGVSEFSDDIPEQSRPGVVKGTDPIVFPKLYNPRSYANQNRLLIELRRFGIPVVNEEPGYEKKGTLAPGAFSGIIPKTSMYQDSETLLSTFWSAVTAGAYSMWGSLDLYSLDDPLPGMENSVVPQYLRVMHDLMTRLPYWEMEPDNEVVSPFEIEIEGKPWRTNFCCSKQGEVYLVFSQYGRNITIELPEGNYEVRRVNPRTGKEAGLESVSGGEQSFTLPTGEWILLFKRKGR